MDRLCTAHKTSLRNLFLFSLLAVIFVSGCGSGSSAPPAISVSVGPASATVQAGGTQQFTATVSNDPNSRGVIWTLSGTGCTGAACGTLSSTTASPVTYTAPANPPASNLTVTITATSVADSTKSGSATITIPTVTVSVAPAAQTVLAGNTQSFTATVQNTGNVAVTWKLTTQAGAACSAGCGTLSSATANPVTYTAPAPPAANLTVLIVATSAADTTKSASATITVPAIAVAVSPGTANVPVNGTQNFTATVTNDARSLGVTWTLTQGGTACSPGCGTITPATTASGAPATYKAPATVPSLATVTVTATSAADTTKANSATATVLGITVAVTPTTANVVVSATAMFTANVQNDISRGGVTWTLSGAGCAAATCGTITPATASGAPATYTAPGTVPVPATVTVTATSVADPTVSSTATVTVTPPPPISVSVSPTSASVVVNRTQSFTAIVQNDPASGGVTWTLSGTGCTGATCGTVSPTTTVSGTPATYTAPTTVPNPATVTITATSVTDTTKSGSATITIILNPPCGTGSESLLNGQYAIALRGFDASGPVGIGATFNTDGAGRVATLVGIEDINSSGLSGVQTNLSINSATSSYSVGSDHRGCLTIATSAGTQTFRFSLGAISSGVASNGHIIQFDNTGSRTAGVLRKQNPTAFSTAQITGNYAFGASGSKSGGGKFAVAGMVSLSGTVVQPGGVLDFNNNGNVDGGGTTYPTNPISIVSGSYTVATSGRGTLSILPSGSTTVNMILYVVSSGELLTMSSDPQTTNSLFVGSAQQQSGGAFSNSSLNAASILYTSGLGNSGVTPVSRASAGIVTFPSSGNFSFSGWQNSGGSISPQSATGTYNVASTGRVTFAGGGGGGAPILYLVSANRGFALFTDGSLTNPAVQSGFLEMQTGGPSFSPSSANGTYAFGTIQPEDLNVSDNAGFATFNGAGQVSGTSDSNSAGSLSGGSTFSQTYSIDATGLGVIPASCTIGTNCQTIFFVISPTKAVVFDVQPNPTPTHPNLQIGEQ